ncbi:DUF3313 domain-containing protein [Pleomorphomonas oryzae]|uniref:DUF3313 domain-containing protein n=1 Tax=Pleomorphomonas oryzae TaxID=261934 RepID=UPI0004160A44|nr:DUF3313 domain-containing protein [Pleomorphomonas oryzae]
MNDASLARARRWRSAALLAAVLVLAGCASVPLRQGGTLTSYDRLGKESGLLSKSRAYADKDALATARTVRILPTAFSPQAEARIPMSGDRDLVTRALDRAVCVALSDQYQVVSPSQPADLTIRNNVIDVLPTNKTVAGISTVASLGSSFVLPVSLPRIPIGLGGIAIEGEALDRMSNQRAAIIWARGANSFTENPRLSDVGDAYSLATSFGDDFSDVIIKGTDASLLDVRLPTMQRIKSFFGGQPKYPACDTFGREPGIPGMVAGMVGAPPQWTDKPPDARR